MCGIFEKSLQNFSWNTGQNIDISSATNIFLFHICLQNQKHFFTIIIELY